MKLRTGFVSNSSSSSYLINIFNKNTLSIISKDMLKTVISDWEMHGLNRSERWMDNLNKALKMKAVKSGLLGITFPSTKEDTYIIQKKKGIYISTCRNHNWDMLDGVLNYGEDNNKIYKLLKDQYFYNIKNEPMHSYEFYDENYEAKCPKCNFYSGFYVINQKGKKLCSFCYRALGPSEDKVIEKIKTQTLKKSNSMRYLKIV